MPGPFQSAPSPFYPDPSQPPHWPCYSHTPCLLFPEPTENLGPPSLLPGPPLLECPSPAGCLSLTLGSLPRFLAEVEEGKDIHQNGRCEFNTHLVIVTSGSHPTSQSFIFSAEMLVWIIFSISFRSHSSHTPHPWPWKLPWIVTSFLRASIRSSSQTTCFPADRFCDLEQITKPLCVLFSHYLMRTSNSDFHRIIVRIKLYIIYMHMYGIIMALLHIWIYCDIH